MAFDKQQTGRVRAAVVVAALVLAIALLVAVLSGALAPKASDGAGASGDESASAADGATHSMEDIDASYEVATAQLESRYQADPSDPAALLSLANGYFDWGMAAMNHATDDAGEQHVRELFAQAISHYDAYLGSNSSKSAEVDRAICQFYGGDPAAATAALEDLTARDGSFAPAWANLGMFYEAAGELESAADAYRHAIEAAGDADTYGVKDYAQQRLDELN